MITVLNENNEVELTEKAFLVKSFRVLYESYTDPGLAIAVFALMHYMYCFDSKFLREFESEQQRISEVKKFIHRGSEVKVTREVRKVMDAYKDLYADEAASTYLVLRRNIEKLKSFAEKMVLFDPNIVAEDGELLVQGLDFVLVDTKEFATVNSLLPKQQKELDDLEVYLRESAKSKIDVYGGGKLGAYE